MAMGSPTRPNGDHATSLTASIAIELLQEYEAHVDWALQPHYNDQDVRLFNEHFGSGDRAFRLNEALHAFDPDGVAVGLQFFNRLR